jgi:hypothetical protein
MRHALEVSLVLFLAACEDKSITQPSMTETRRSSTPSSRPMIENYSVTSTIDSACTSMPANVRSRTYSGASDGGRIRLAGAVFDSWEHYGLMNVISLAQFGTQAQAWFQDGPIVELVDPDGALMIEGHAMGVFTGASVELPVSATYAYCPKRNPDGFGCSVPVITCRSTMHKLTLTRE